MLKCPYRDCDFEAWNIEEIDDHITYMILTHIKDSQDHMELRDE